MNIHARLAAAARRTGAVPQAGLPDSALAVAVQQDSQGAYGVLAVRAGVTQYRVRLTADELESLAAMALEAAHIARQGAADSGGNVVALRG